MIAGVWVPLITPFKNGNVDIDSYCHLVEHYIGCGAAGIFPLGTTGESPTINEAEAQTIIAETVRTTAGRTPVFVGIGGNATNKIIENIKRWERFDFDGIVSVCPYYSRPSQDGLIAHFTAISKSTDRPILIYNIPYRTSVNMTNDTMLRLAELPNIVGAKDSCGSLTQSLDLLARKPSDFAVLTGEDHMFYQSLCNGAEGGILAAAHLATDRWIKLTARMTANDHQGAHAIWTELTRFVPKLFAESNPMPLKYCLWRLGMIASPECRLPLTSISQQLAAELDVLLEGLSTEKELAVA